MKILITPLNWGLGHATRCIPIINEMISCKVKVIIGSDGSAAALLKVEYPELTHYTLPGYNVHYSGRNLTWSIFKQSYKIKKAIEAEHQEIQKIVASEGIDLIISDNRYGCWHHHIPSYIITHQTNIIAKYGLSWGANRIISSYLKSFNEIWVPDHSEPNDLSGDLSKNKFDKKSKRIGILSRLTSLEREKKYNISIILSGPEPSRSALEAELIDKCKDLEHLKIVLVRGVISDSKPESGSQHIKMVNYMTSAELNELICSSELIIARSGYSSLMDMYTIGASVLFIPTPGQPEQEYLAKRCKLNRWANVQYEKGVAVSEAYAARENFKFPSFKKERWNFDIFHHLGI